MRLVPFLITGTILTGFPFTVLSQTHAPEIHTGSFHGLPITYQVIDGLPIFEGDIILDSGAPKSDNRVNSAFTSATTRLWTNNTVPYTIDSDIPNQTRITDAIKYYNENAPVKFQPRGGEANYLRFMRTTIGDGVCYSSVGMVGGEQLIRTDDGCGTPGLIHEMGHTVGFFHEQDRKDRNRYLTVLYENIDKAQFGEFPIGGSNEQDLGSYEYASIMHYSPTSFSRTGDVVMQTVPAGIPFREINVLSPGDLDTLNRMYGRTPTMVTVTSNPPGLKLVVDEASITTPQVFPWSNGSSHSVDVPDAQTSGNARYVFGRWSDGGAQSHTIAAAPSTGTLYTANFIRQVQVTTQVSPAGAGTVAVGTSSSDGYYTGLTKVALTATSSPGNFFLRWQTVTGGSCPAPRSANPATVLTRTVDITCIATFAQTPVTTITTDPVGRSVTVDGAVSGTPASFSFAPGSTHTVAASSPASTSTSTVRYKFQDWSDSGAATHTITAANGGTITARFTTQYPINLQAAIPQGTVTANPPSTDGFYDAGTSVQVTANPASGYVLQRWTSDLSGTVNPQTLVMDEQKAIGAVFNRPTNIPAFTPVSGATFQIGPVSPGEIITLFGAGLGPSALAGAQLDASGRLATRVAETRVLFDGVPAPVVYASATQTSVIVPYSVAGKATTVVVVEYQGKQSTGVAQPVGPTLPGLFTSNSSGAGFASVFNQDGTVNSASNPAPRGSVVVFFGTGEGQTIPAGSDGAITGAPPPKPALPVSVRIGGKPADLLYAGEAPELVSGVLQVNATVPTDAFPGNASIYLVVGDAASPMGVNLAIK